MMLTLSSSAAPDATLTGLLAACARRGIAGLELVEGDGHGLSPRLDYGEALAIRDAVADSDAEIRAYYLRGIQPGDAVAAARFAAALGAPLVVPASAFDRSGLPQMAEAFVDAGARLLLAHGSDPLAVEALRWLLDPLPHEGAIGLAWEVRPATDDPSRVPDVLDAAGKALRYVRLHGGGSESQTQTGLGVGSLMARLTLARFGGTLALTPSTSSYRYAWAAWLGRAGGWGCGSKQSDASLVTLEPRPLAAHE